MNWKLLFLILTVPAGFALTCVGAVQFDRLQVEGVETTWWSYPVNVLLPFAGSFLLGFLRYLIRRKSRTAVPLVGAQTGQADAAAPETHSRSLKALAREVRELMARGDTAAVRVKADAADVIQGKAQVKE